MQKRVIIFGAGKRGKEVLRETKDQVISIWDNSPAKVGTMLNGIQITAPHALADCEYDSIVVAIRDWFPLQISQFNAMLAQLTELGIPVKKIEYAKGYVDDNPRVCFLRNLSWQIYEYNVCGAVAECGVYRGHFAQYIREFFHDRTLYLFDTFEGFAQDDVDVENSAHSNASELIRQGYHSHGFSVTNVDSVLRRVGRENLIIKKGRIPETFADIDDVRFAFVNLDMDLYLPQLAGLRFFYDRMARGGVILVHDYFDKNYGDSVRRAVDDFEKDNGKVVCMPIGDSSSLAIIKA